MVDHLLRVHIQSLRAFGPWWTLSYNVPSFPGHGSAYVRPLQNVRPHGRGEAPRWGARGSGGHGMAGDHNSTEGGSDGA